MLNANRQKCVSSFVLNAPFLYTLKILENLSSLQNSDSPRLGFEELA